MTSDERKEFDGLAAPVPPPPSMPPARAPSRIPRNTVHDTWNWLWKDTLGRVLPFAVAAGVYARLSGNGAPAIGLTGEDWVQEVLLGTAIGVPMAAIAAMFRGRVAPAYRLPTAADQALQTAFYLGVNAPAEECFWRGTVQTLAISGLSQVPGIGGVAALLGWMLTTAGFGAYHRLGGWSWRAIAGVTAAGGLFGGLYLWSSRQSIVLPIVVHGFATAGFLSWGDVLLHWRTQHQGKRQQAEPR